MGQTVKKKIKKMIRRGQHTALGPHQAREGENVSFILQFLTEIWPARHILKDNVARGRK
jgi:hypothetical protein